jgi:hypothetical protein
MNSQEMVRLPAWFETNSRAVLIIITLFIPAEDDVLSLDAVIDGRMRRIFGS